VVIGSGFKPEIEKAATPPLQSHKVSQFHPEGRPCGEHIGKPVLTKFSTDHSLANLGMESPKSPRPPQIVAGSGPSLLTAVEEQLGLRLLRQKLNVECLVIESVERPSAN
jgi:hypothetical protein